MKMFEGKSKMTVKEWCEDFYGDYVFASSIYGEDPWQIFCDSVHNQIFKADSSFSEVDVEDFSDEMLALRLEVIGIAWIMLVNINLAPKQSECTRLYLQNHGHEYFWDMMEPYNSATAKATVGGMDKGRARITFINIRRTQLFDEWVPFVADPKDAARPANRVGSVVSWKHQKTHIYLSFALTDQLQCEINKEAREKVMAIIHGFFVGVSEELQKVKIVS